MSEKLKKRKVSDDINELEGIDKAAILMLALPDECVTQIFEKLHEDEIRVLSMTMASLGGVQAETVEALYIEFTELVAGTGSVTGNYSATEHILNKVFDSDKVSEIMEEIRGPAGRTMWEKLANVNEGVLASYLKNEYPQTVAVIMSRIKPEHASRVLSHFPEEFAMEIIMRMLGMEPVQREVLDDIENTLRGEFISNLSASNQPDPHEKMAEIFNSFDRPVEEKLMEALEKRNLESAELIKSLMFTFEDLVKLDPSAVQTVIRVADKTKLPLALKGAPEAVKNLFFSNMSERAAKLMKEDMEGMGPVKLRDVDDAQAAIVLQVKGLIDKGEIEIIEIEGDEEMIE